MDKETKKDDDAGEENNKTSKKDGSDFIKLRVVGQVLVLCMLKVQHSPCIQ